MTVQRDIVFVEHTGYRPVSLDLYLPEGEGPWPVILQLHGGGWRLGSRSVFTPFASEQESFGRIVAAGFAVVAADYRLSGEAIFPAQVADTVAALEWIGAHAGEYGLDASRIVLWGGSAGGTLAALVGLQRRRGVVGVIDWYGPSDLPAMAEHTKNEDAPGDSREDQWLGAPVGSVPARARAASPVHQVHADAPPFHLAHGAADPSVPLAQSEALRDALAAVGVEVELYVEPDAGHFWKGVDAERTAALFDRAIAFAQRVTA